MRRNHANSCLRSFALAALGVGVCVSVGCSEGPVNGYRLDPTPEAMTASQSGDEVANTTTTSFDTNFRLFNEDLGKFLLIDKPSLLTDKPVPH